MRFRFLVLPTVITTLALAPAALAQGKDAKGEGETSDGATDPKSDDASEASEAKADEAADASPASAKPAEPAADPNDPTEDPAKTYYFVGARWRQTLLPKFMLSPFVSGGPSSVWIPSFGAEVTMRQAAFDTVFFVTYSDWSMDPFAFKGKNEAPTAWEIVESRLKMIDIGAEWLWSTDFDKRFSFQYGVSANLSVVVGDLKRVQGQPKPGGNPDTAEDIVPCPAYIPGNRFCTDDNNHYGNYTEPSWFNGGSKPNFYLGFGPQIAFRFKPIKQVMGRLNLGWNLFAGPFFGLSGNYGI